MTIPRLADARAAADFDPLSGAIACRNCGAAHRGAFCSECGQGRAERITLRSFAHEIAGQVLEIDHGLLHTFVDLLRRPGTMIREYLTGRRRYYTSPVTYVLIASALSVLRAAVARDGKAMMDAMQKTADPSLHVIFRSSARLELFQRELALMETNKFAIAALTLIPITLMLRVLFRKRGVNLAELGVFTCYAFGQSTFIGVIVGTLLIFTNGSAIVSAVFIVATLVYLFLGGFGLFGRSVSTAVRIAGSVVLGLVLMDTLLYAVPFILVR